MRSTAHTYDARTALLGGLIDYAGAFPPAALPLEKALKEASAFRAKATHPWLMGRMVLTMKDLKQIHSAELYRSGADGSPWLFTALGSPAESDSLVDVSRAIEFDMREIRRWNDRSMHSSLRASITAYECKVPVSGLRDPKALGALAVSLDRIAKVLGTSVVPYFELDGDGPLVELAFALIEMLSDWMSENSESHLYPGIKVRTGGKKVPKTSELAQVLRATTSHGVRFKATQGLHAAVTHGDALGFVNLFGALTLSRALGQDKFGEKQIQDCLETEEIKKFKFEAGAFHWKDFSLDLETIERARHQHGGAFGSCSLDEPDESLKQEFP